MSAVFGETKEYSGAKIHSDQKRRGRNKKKAHPVRGAR
jgi:hypothetical protein